MTEQWRDQFDMLVDVNGNGCGVCGSAYHALDAAHDIKQADQDSPAGAPHRIDRLMGAAARHAWRVALNEGSCDPVGPAPF